MHAGDYAKLGAAHDAIRVFCKQRGLKFAGPSWEIYGHGNDDPRLVTTDVFHLVETSCCFLETITRIRSS